MYIHEYCIGHCPIHESIIKNFPHSFTDGQTVRKGELGSGLLLQAPRVHIVITLRTKIN